MFHRLLSWLWPLSASRVDGHFGPLEVRWENGRKVLNSEHGNQSFGSLHRVWRCTLDQLDLRKDPPRSMLLLGLGGGSAIEIIRDELGIKCPITAVELDPAMLAVAREQFALDRHADLDVVLGDAMIQVHGLRTRFDLVLVDLFDDLDLARGVDSRAFMHGLRECCAAEGVVCINTVAYDERSNTRCEAVRKHAGTVFHDVHEIQLEEVNRMFILR